MAEMQAKIDSQDADKEAKQSAKAAADAALSEAQEDERSKVYALEESDKAMTSAQETLAAAEASSIGLTSELAKAEKTIETLKNTLTERFTPLKEGTVTVKRDQKKLVEAFSSDIQP